MKFIVRELTDDILLSPRVYNAWTAYVPIAVADILKEAGQKKVLLTSNDISDEQIKIYENETAEIFVEIKKINKTISMKVPQEEWTFK